MGELFSPRYNSVVEFRSNENTNYKKRFRLLGIDGSSFRLKNFQTVPETTIYQNESGVGARLYTADGVNFVLLTNDPNHFLTVSDTYKLIGNYKYWKYGIH